MKTKQKKDKSDDLIKAITLLKFSALFLGKAVAENLMQDQVLTPQRLLKRVNEFLDAQE